MQDLKLAIIQSYLHWGDKEKNLEMFGQHLNKAGQTDLILFPEMFNTAFMVYPADYAESMKGPTVNWMKEMAAENNCAIAGSLIIKEDNNYYNRLVFMLADGSFETYDKRHLFSMAGEDERFSAGRQKKIINYKGWKICPLICYDLRFPVWSKSNAEDGNHEYDLLIYLANWPEVRNHSWKSLLVARAIENQAYVAGINRIGEDGNGQNHSGDSVVLDYLGKAITAIPENEEYIEEVILSSNKLSGFRKQFQANRDWDSFIVHA